MGTESGRPTRSLRQRLIAGIVMAVSLAAFAQALLMHLLWSGYESRLIDQVVSEELDRSIELFSQNPALAHPKTADLRLFVLSDGNPGVSDPLPPELESLHDVVPLHGRMTLISHEGFEGVIYRVGLVLRDDVRFLMVYNARDHADRRREVLWAVMAIALLITLAASRFALGWVDHLLGGLSRLQQRVARRSQDERFHDSRMDAEIAALACALDDQRLQVIGALRKERAFAAAASHELRTPLTRITTGSQVLLARSDLPEGVLSRLRSITDAANELQRLLDVLLEVARWQPGGDPPRTLPPSGPPESLSAIVARCLDTLASEARLLGSSISSRLDDPSTLVTHPMMLEVVLTNLLRNAIRHGRSAPIRILASAQGIVVEDTGPGIDPTQLERIFDPFWQGRDSRDEAGPLGLGLGLTIIERICAAAGWRLSIESQPGVGTRAEVSFRFE